MPRLSTAAIAALVAGVAVIGAAGAAVALTTAPADPQVLIAPITLEPQGSPVPSATPTPDSSSPIAVQPSQPHDLGDDHGGDDDSSGHGGDDDDNSGHGSDDD
jgi:hypothetical protein